MDEPDEPTEEEREMARKAKSEKEYLDALYGVKDGDFK